MAFITGNLISFSLLNQINNPIIEYKTDTIKKPKKEEPV